MEHRIYRPDGSFENISRYFLDRREGSVGEEQEPGFRPVRLEIYHGPKEGYTHLKGVMQCMKMLSNMNCGFRYKNAPIEGLSDGFVQRVIFRGTGKRKNEEIDMGQDEFFGLGGPMRIEYGPGRQIGLFLKNRPEPLSE